MHLCIGGIFLSPVPQPDYPLSILFAYPAAGWGGKMNATALSSDGMDRPFGGRLRDVCDTRLPYRVGEMGPFGGITTLTERE